MEFMILDAIQTLRTPWLDGFMVFVSSLGNKGAVWIALAVVLLAFPKYRRLGAVVACALVLDLVACNLVLKPLVARPRPCDINTALDYLIARPHGWSFPSGHTAASFAAASALWFGKSRLWIPCGILAALIAFFPALPLCAFSHRCAGRRSGWYSLRCTGGVCGMPGAAQRNKG